MVYLVCVVLIALTAGFLVALDRSGLNQTWQEWEDWNG